MMAGPTTCAASRCSKFDPIRCRALCPAKGAAEAGLCLLSCRGLLRREAGLLDCSFSICLCSRALFSLSCRRRFCRSSCPGVPFPPCSGPPLPDIRSSPKPSCWIWVDRYWRCRCDSQGVVSSVAPETIPPAARPSRRGISVLCVLVLGSLIPSHALQQRRRACEHGARRACEHGARRSRLAIAS